VSYAAAVLALGPYVYWRMASTADSGSAGRTLTVSGATFGAAGALGADDDGALSFDGVNDSASATLDLSTTTEVTLAMWVKWAAYANDDALLLEHNGQWFNHDGSIIVDPNNGNSGAEAGTVSVGFRFIGNVRGTFPRSALPAGEWHHLALVLRQTGAGAISAFVDGQPVTVTMVESGAQAWAGFANATLSLMSRGGSSLFAAGVLDDFAVFRSALTADDIAGLYTASLPPAPVLSARYSGGTGNGSGAASIGGSEGNALSGAALFGTVGNAARLAGLTDYRIVYLRNSGAATATDVRAWIAAGSAPTDTAEAIGASPTNPAALLASPTSTPVGVTFSTPANYTGGIHLGDLAPGESVPLVIRRAVSAGAAGESIAFTIGASWAGADAPAMVDVSYLIVAAVTMYVDAGSGGASDANTRAQATNQATPLRTIQQAGRLAQPGDTIIVKPAANADPTNIDPRMYVGLRHQFLGGEALPYGDDTGNDPITLKGSGAVAAGLAPIISAQSFKGLRNWIFEDFQQGYDIDSGRDYLTIGDMRQCADLTFRRVLYTGGGYDIRQWTGALTWQDCTIRSPFSPAHGGGGQFLDGVGFHFAYVDNNDLAAGESAGLIQWTGCTFTKVEGEDCVQAYLGGFDASWDGARMLIDGCLFVDIIQAQFAGAPHTDCIQILGGRDFDVRNSAFLNCDSVLIASDYHNHTVRFESNLVVGGNVPVQIQGTDEITIRQNTLLRSFSGVSVNLFVRQAGVTSKVLMLNNIMVGYARTSDFASDPASVISHNMFIGAPDTSDIPGLPEFGTSARMAPLEGLLDLPTNYELVNSPAPTPGVSDGVVLGPSNGGTLATDRLGRAYATPPDVGCHQSSLAMPVSAAARAPYVIARTPDVGAVDAGQATDIVVTLFPKPGATINPATVTTASFYVTDANGHHLPVVGVTIGAPDTAGHQALTLNIDGMLYPLATYTVAMTSGLADTEGSAIEPVSWSFRVLGPAGAAVYGPSELGIRSWVSEHVA
jgi:hypothetical protein